MIPSPDQLRYISPTDYDPSQHGPLIDVRSEAEYEKEHARESQNLCVYETAFAEKAPERFEDRSAPLTVYGQDARFKAAEAAVQRLLDLGYQNVFVVEGGLREWKEANRPTEQTPEPEEPAPIPTHLELNLDDSKLRWIGRNLANQHYGTIALNGGSLELSEEGFPLRGEIEADMTRLFCDDIEDPDTNSMLIRHLKHRDFFLVDEHPTATFSATAFEYDPSIEGRPNGAIAGDMTIRGQTAPFSAPMTFALQDGKATVAANFDLDRTLFGAIYGSARYFERLGMHLVNDLAYVQVVAVFAAKD